MERELTPTSTEPSQDRRRQWLTYAQHAAMLLALLVWARVVTVRSGGRDDGAELWGCLSLLPAVLLLRPVLRDQLALLSLVAAALVVCLSAPYGFIGGQVIAEAAYTGAVFAVVRTYGATAERRLALAAAVCLVSLDQFAQAFLAWWGSADPHHQMIGTFYWHNQYAAFLLPGVALGAALAVFCHSVHRLIGSVTAPVCMAGIVYSTSRATMMIAAACLAVVLALAVTASDRRQRIYAAVGIGLLTVGSLFFFTSAVFFAHAGNPFGGTEARASQETLSSNTGYRIDFWKAAVGEFADRPVVGGGFGSFGELSGTHLPPAAVRTLSAHNEFLQSLAEGGLVWGLPVIGLALAAGVGALRRLGGRLRAPAPDRAVVVGGTLALAGLGLHAAVDFDWSYPSLAVSFAVVAGLVLAVPGGGRPAGTTRLRAPLAVLACLLLALGAQVARAHEATTRDLNRTGAILNAKGPASAAEALLNSRSWFPDPRIDAQLLGLGIARGANGPLTLPDSLLAHAVANTTDYASVADDVNARRAAVLLGLGRTSDALASERRMALARAHSRPSTLQAYALLMSLSGEREAATDLLAGTIVLRGPEATANAALGPQLYTLYQQLAELAPGSMKLRCAGSALRAAGLDLPQEAPPLAVARDADRCTPLREKGLA